MVKIILILALLQYIYYFIFKPKLNILSCGIFGQATNTPAKLEIASVNLLGIYNIERGKQSCGLTWDGDIYHGVDKDKLYIDFIKNRQIKPKYFPTMFGHTRQSSFGNGITLENAHPFGYGVNANNTGFEFIFVHNGTLKNAKELAKKYDIELTVKYQKKLHNSDHTYEASRDKIDSEILGEILWKEKSYHVLSEYVGTAACVWMWCDQPNKLYLWSGASKLHIDDDSNTMFEERPLCVYTKNKNNMFFSSLEDSLTSIGGVIDTNIEQIARNQVHIVTDGDYKNCEKILATRKNACQDDSFKTNYPRQNYTKFNRTEEYYNSLGVHDYPNMSNCSVKNTELDIQNDLPLFNINDYSGKIYSKSLRYWKNGHVINGVYIYILGYGFKKVGDNYSEAYTQIELQRGKVFLIDDWSLTLKEGFIPIEKSSKIQLYYFIDGAMLKSNADYVKCLELKKNLKTNSKYLSAIELSYMTKHPIATLITSFKPQVFFKGHFYTGNCVELGFEKVYYFDNGKFTKFDKRLDFVKIEKPVIQLPMNFKDSKKEITHNSEVLKQSINNIHKFEKEFENDLEEKLLSRTNNYEIEKEEELDDFIEDFVSEGFTLLIDNIENIMKDLKDYEEHSSVIEANRTLDMILNTCKQYVV